MWNYNNLGGQFTAFSGDGQLPILNFFLAPAGSWFCGLVNHVCLLFPCACGL
jgi:hypothetical protein